MTTLVDFQSARRNQQHEVETLLGELDNRRRELYRLKAGGALPAGMRAQKSDYHDVRRRLSDVLGDAA
jgi:hypothetical protein